MREKIQEIYRKAHLTGEERAELEKLLNNLQKKSEEIKLKLTFDRWVAVGIHLINMLQRRHTLGSIPVIEDAMWEQISLEMKAFSEYALENYRNAFDETDFLGEVFLLAVHFETAKLLDQGV
jgi:PRD domain protein (TIGR03582 family)